MKLVWCPETASKSYLDTVRALAGCDSEETNVAELVAAMAGGWRAQLIVEAWAARDAGHATSVALAAAARHTRSRRICVVPDEQAAAENADFTGSSSAEEVVISPSEDEEEVSSTATAMQGVDFMVIDGRRRDAAKLVRTAMTGPRGMVVVRINAARSAGSTAGARGMVGAGKRLVRAVFLPIGDGVEILHVGVGKGPSVGGGRSRWIKHVDRNTGEEHVFLRDLRC